MESDRMKRDREECFDQWADYIGSLFGQVGRFGSLLGTDDDDDDDDDAKID